MTENEKQPEVDIPVKNDFDGLGFPHLTGMPAVENATPEITDLSQKGYQSLKEGRTQEAEDFFAKILSMDENNNYALVGLGDAARKQNRYQHAIRYYERCLKHHPGNNYALFGLADCYKALHQYTKAIQIWEEYLKHDDKNITVLTRVADAYRKVRNLSKSQELYLRVLEMENENAYALIGLGHLYYDFKEYEKALHFWHKMVEVHGENVDIRVLTSIGNCHRKLKTHRQGIEFFRRALELEPDNFYALFGMADCYRGLNENEQSLEYWSRILALDPENKVILTRAGDSYRAMGNFEKAEEFYNHALSIEFDAYAVLGLALMSKERGKFQEALETLQNLLRNDQKNPRLYIEISECYLGLDNKRKALDILNAYISMGMRNMGVSEMLERLRREMLE
jgi:tetratricopeptide (TPR) repeat protein